MKKITLLALLFAFSVQLCHPQCNLPGLDPCIRTKPPRYAAPILSIAGSLPGASASVFPLSITGTGLLMSTPGDFSILATPGSQIITAGDTASYTVGISSNSGSVTLFADGLPPDASASFSPASITGTGGPATLFISTIASSSIGSFTIEITGDNGYVRHTTTVILNITQGDLCAQRQMPGGNADDPNNPDSPDDPQNPGNPCSLPEAVKVPGNQ